MAVLPFHPTTESPDDSTKFLCQKYSALVTRFSNEALEVQQLEAVATTLKNELDDEENARLLAEKAWQSERRKFDEESAFLQRHLVSAEKSQKARADLLFKARSECEVLDRRRRHELSKHENASSLTRALQHQQVPRSSQDMYDEVHHLSIEAGRLMQQHQDASARVEAGRKEITRARSSFPMLENELASEFASYESLEATCERLSDEVCHAERSEALAQRKATDALHRLANAREEARSQDTCLSYLRQENQRSNSSVHEMLRSRDEMAVIKDQLEPLQRENMKLQVALQLEAEQRSQILEANGAEAKYDSLVGKYNFISSEFGDVSACGVLREQKLAELQRSLSEMGTLLRSPELQKSASRASKECAVREELRSVVKQRQELDSANLASVEKLKQVSARKERVEAQLVETQQRFLVCQDQESRAMDEVSAAQARRRSQSDVAMRNATLLQTSANQTSALSQHIRELEKDRLRFPSVDIASSVPPTDDLHAYIP
jgi:hypothetical protein